MNDHKDQLERVLDHYGITDMLHTLADICQEKAEHILTSYNDKNLSDRWCAIGEQYTELARNILLAS